MGLSLSPRKTFVFCFGVTPGIAQGSLTSQRLGDEINRGVQSAKQSFGLLPDPGKRAEALCLPASPPCKTPEVTPSTTRCGPQTQTFTSMDLYAHCKGIPPLVNRTWGPSCGIAVPTRTPTGPCGGAGSGHSPDPPSSAQGRWRLQSSHSSSLPKAVGQGAPW